MPQSGIYQITNTITQKCYVGSSIHIGTRRSQHFGRLRNGKHSNRLLQRAWDKYGETSFIFSALEVGVDAENLISREQWWIDTLNPAYNIRKTAERTASPEPETREKIRQWHIGRKSSPETIEKLRSSHMGQKPTPEALEKNRQAQMGKSPSIETREKIRQTKLGKKCLSSATHEKRSPETCEKIRQAKLGKEFSAEHRRNLSESKKVYWANKRTQAAQAETIQQTMFD